MKNKKMKMLSLCIFLVVLVSMIVGCKGADTNAEEKISSDLKLYYVNDEYVATGNEDLNQMKEPYEVTIQTKPKDAYLEAVSKLKEAPLDGYVTMLSEQIIIQSVKVEDGTAFVDLSSKNLSGGSMEEGLLVNQIVLTLLDSFDDIQQVQFTLDGGVTESLMGHVDVSKPFTVSDTGDGNKKVMIVE
ncbi:GerMN domain-containing protein [Sinanaerobacter sp. ZZT-01]|uniref:GerMN domain-containing protein n=1 Tax=Sinanaerobacter sp. ZZT-01 TaxID=3111540 RepID=UPI002D79E07C|nr:GerMN domain-containing protein [Sinanaerobacter sp. ZZT-01]WRR94138.1 GerMN domain-containing protein [Sinanaerobacter sp. ZZT-01]